MGDYCYVNVNYSFIDEGEIEVGYRTEFGPVVIACGSPCHVIRPISEQDNNLDRKGYHISEKDLKEMHDLEDK